MTETVFANAKIITEDTVLHGTMKIVNGVIAAIDSGAGVPSGAINCGGDYIAPGLIELHTDNLERHLSPRPQVSWPKRAAVLGHDRELAGSGITTVFDALRVGSEADQKRKGLVRYARETADNILDLMRQRALKVSHYIHLRAELCTDTLVEELHEFSPNDRVGLVSLMDHTPGQRQFRDTEKLRVYLMGKHGYDDAGVEAHFTRLKEFQSHYLEKHRAATVAYAKEVGAVLASHDDTTAEDVSASACEGVTVAEFPTTSKAATACRAHGQYIVMGAPNIIRGGSHSGNVAAHDLANNGLLDILSSDYVPASLLNAAVTLGILMEDMAAGIRKVTAVPADAAGFDDRGRIAPEKRADLVRFVVHDGLPMISSVWVGGARVA
uniref:Metal-dependent hydrolase involved in phosphonate metabolism n=1 Tax=uncultured bacterium HF0070_11A08 TaxID=710812 RepID=E0XPH4_9BACT|nr:metal-dependent hydrolase involved in phosphonate metabolism [uncultured bacterium HF0070_11A08]